MTELLPFITGKIKANQEAIFSLIYERGRCRGRRREKKIDREKEGGRGGRSERERNRDRNRERGSDRGTGIEKKRKKKDYGKRGK